MTQQQKVVMVGVSQIMKVLGSIAVLVIGVSMLWEVPKWDNRSIARENISTSSSSPVDLPTFDHRKFLRHTKTRLPQYREQFQLAGEKHDLSWVLLASQAYQESRWNRNARSPTGVRGLMMLTRDTAADLGITNRLDPRNSIHGGARYLARLHARLPRNIQGPDRMFFALAAYNVGMGHVKDAQILARRFKKDPTRWDDLKTVLPLLAQKKYYKTLPNRYARGWEPVQYVKRIRAYRKILKSLVQPKASSQTEL